MSISEPFIKRPIATSLVMVAILLFGLMSYLRLPVAALRSLSAGVLSLCVVNGCGETRLAQMISQTRGVAQVTVMGSQKYAVRVQADPERLSALGIGLDDVASSIQGANVNLPTGALYGPRTAFAIETNGQLATAKPYEDVVVAYRNGAAVRVKDLGRTLDSVENDKTAAWRGDANGMPRAVVLAIQKQPGANTVEVVDDVLRLLPAFRQEIPASVDLDVLFDRAPT